jgi:hypothetical protein
MSLTHYGDVGAVGNAGGAGVVGNWMGRVLSFQLDVWTDAYHS